MIKGMYNVVQTSVLVDDDQTEMFDLHTGVRQGCVVSPVLFSFFINGLARDKRENTRSRRLLLYADDIVLMAETKSDLQKMLDIVTSYSRKWRFRVNPKKGKSEVCCLGGSLAKARRRGNGSWQG